MNKIRKGDEVLVLTGKDRGRRGTVLRRVDDERVVVEGVETHEQFVMLGELGVDSFQGFLFGRPAPVSEIG